MSLNNYATFFLFFFFLLSFFLFSNPKKSTRGVKTDEVGCLLAAKKMPMCLHDGHYVHIYHHSLNYASLAISFTALCLNVHPLFFLLWKMEGGGGGGEWAGGGGEDEKGAIKNK